MEHVMSLEAQWQKIKSVVETGQASTIYCSIASISDDGAPNVTPIGTVFLNDSPSGYYFDHYATALPQNIDRNPNICLMAVNAGKWFWLKSFLTGQFVAPPGVRLYGTAGPKREATSKEIDLIEARVRPTKWLKGSRLLWSNFTHVRELKFTSYRPVVYPKMMDHLW